MAHCQKLLEYYNALNILCRACFVNREKEFRYSNIILISLMFLSFSNVLLEGECHSIETIVTLVFCLESVEVAYFPY